MYYQNQIDYTATYVKNDIDSNTISLTLTSADGTITTTLGNINKIQKLADIQSQIANFQAQITSLNSQITFLTNLINTIQGA